MGGLLSDEDEDFHNKKKKTDVFKSNATESTGKQESRFDPVETKNKQNRAKVVAELFGLEEEKKQPQQSQNDRDSSSIWLGLKDPVPAENKTPEVAKAASKTPEHGIYCITVAIPLIMPRWIRLTVKYTSYYSFRSDIFTIFIALSKCLTVEVERSMPAFAGGINTLARRRDSDKFNNQSLTLSTYMR